VALGRITCCSEGSKRVLVGQPCCLPHSRLGGLEGCVHLGGPLQLLVLPSVEDLRQPEQNSPSRRDEPPIKIDESPEALKAVVGLRLQEDLSGLQVVGQWLGSGFQDPVSQEVHC
jgi:hypothetical protein